MITCPMCHHTHDFDAKYCVECGVRMESYTTPMDNIERLKIWGGELRILSAVFINISGFDSLVIEQDHHTVMTMLRECFVDIDEFIRAYDGTVDLILPDNRVLGIFGAPHAHKDDSLRAIRCATHIQEWWKTKKATVDLLKKMNMTIGVNTGRAFFGYILEEKSTLTVIGDTVNTASRIAEICPPNEIVMSDSTYNRVENHVEAEHIGERSVKGKTTKVDIYVLKELKEETEIVPAQKIPLFGRDTELKELTRLATHLSESKMKFCIISGQMGIGKTRLKEEFIKTLSESNTVSLVETHCSAEIQSPYNSFKFLLRRHFNLGDIDNQDELRTQLTRIAEKRSLSVPSTQGVHHLFCTDLQRLKRGDLFAVNEEIYAGVRDILQYECRNKPLILVFEEFNKVDDMSRQLVAYLAAELVNEPLMFLMVNALREFITSVKLEVEEINLTPLSLSHIKELSSFLLDKVDDKLMEFIFNAAGGNPLFTIEAIRNTRRTGLIRRVDGCWLLDRDQRLPFLDDLYGVVMSTIDSLPSDYRLILDYASVIGYSFSGRVLAGLLNQHDLQARLDYLSEQGYIILTKNGKDPVYVFRHNLLKDAAYTILPLRKRKEIHKLVAVLYEEVYPNRLFDFYETIGHHYLTSEVFDKAAEYLKLAGDKAKNLFALEQATHFYTMVMKIAQETGGEFEKNLRQSVMLNFADVYELTGEIAKMQKIAQQGLSEARASQATKMELNFVERYAYALFLNHQFDKAEGLLLTGIEHCTNDIADVRSLLYSDLGLLYQYKYEYEKSILNYNLSWNAARSHDSRKGEILCLYNLAQLHRDLGNYEQALEYLTYGVENLISADDVRWSIHYKYTVGDIKHCIWNVDNALTIYDECMKKADSIGNIETFIKAALGCIDIYSRQGEQVRAREYMKLVDGKISFLIREYLLAEVNLKKAWLYLYEGDNKRAFDFMQNAQRAAKKLRDQRIEFHCSYLMSRIEPENALDHALKALDIAEDLKLAPLIAQTLYQLTEICIALGDTDKARLYGQKALLVYDDTKLKLSQEHQQFFNKKPEYARLLEV
jgi:class 3 adenylate cyclase/tetratricopeptide (TPR) repeat protein